MPQSTIPLILTHDSSQLHGYGYDAASQTLAIEFKSNHQKLTYHYPNFSAESWAAFQAAESKGSFFYKHIKPAYPEGFVRMFKDEPAPAAV